MKKCLLFIFLVTIVHISNAQNDNNPLIPARIDGKYGYIDKNGKWVIEPQFYYANEFVENGLAEVIINGKTEFINVSGNIVSKPQTTISEVNKPKKKELICFKVGSNNTSNNTNRQNYTYQDGDEMVEIAEPIQSQNYKYGFKDQTGKIVIEPKFEEASDFTEDGLARIKLNGKYGYIDKTGKIVIEPKYDFISSYLNDDLLLIRVNYKWGYINKTGKIVIEPKFDELDHFRDGLAIAKINGKYGYLDKNGTWVIEPKFERARIFTYGLAAVSVNGKCGYIDKTGKMVIELESNLHDHNIDYFADNGLARILINGKHGCIDTMGNIVIQPIYDRIEIYKNIIFVRENDKWGIVDKQGNYIATPQFDGVKCHFRN